jgi:hypothetical protein
LIGNSAYAGVPARTLFDLVPGERFSREGRSHAGCYAMKSNESGIWVSFVIKQLQERHPS